MYTRKEVLEFYKSALKEAGLDKEVSNPSFENYEVEYSSHDEFCSIALWGVVNTLDSGGIEQIGVEEITKEKNGNWILTQI